VIDRRRPTIALPLAVGVALLALAATMSAALAQEGVPELDPSDEPIEITADGGIEWNREARTYAARGNAEARRGALSVHADALVAHYRERDDGRTEVHLIEALGHVKIASETVTVTGDRAEYDVAGRTAVVTGEDLKLVTDADVITARDRLTYSSTTREAVAEGEVVVLRDKRKLEADKITARLAKGAEGKLELDTAEAEGNVRITTEREFVSADRGTYDAKRQFAVLTGGVKVTQNQNQLDGEYAEIDLKNGVSRMLGAPPGQGSGKVRGLVLPGAKPTVGN